MATVKFPSEMPSAADVGGNDKLMISKDGSGEAFQVSFSNVKQYLEITDIELDPVQGGSSQETATVIPSGPAGQNRKMDASPGWYSVNGFPVEATAGHVWKWFWNGSTNTWSLVDMGELPEREGTNFLNPVGEDVPKEKAVANYISYNTVPAVFSKNLFDTSLAENGYYINSSSSKAGEITGGGTADGWAFTGLIPLPKRGVFNWAISGNKLRKGVAFYDSKGNPTAYFDTNLGTYTSKEGDFFIAANLESPAEPGYSEVMIRDASTSPEYVPFIKFISKEGVEGLPKLSEDIDNSFEFNVVTSENLLNTAEVSLQTWIQPTGDEVTGGGTAIQYNYSGYIPANAKDIFEILNSFDGGYGVRGYATYSAPNRDGFIKQTSVPATTKQVELEDDSNIKFVRFGLVGEEFISEPNTYYPDNMGVFKGIGNKYSAYGDSGSKVKLKNSPDTEKKQDQEIATILDIKNMLGGGFGGSLQYSISDEGELTLTGDKGNIKGLVAEDRGYLGNNMFNFKSYDILGISTNIPDDVAPIHAIKTTIGANHGGGSRLATISNHGFTNSDIGKAFTQSNRTLYLARIIDKDTAQFIGENTGTLSNPTFQSLSTGILIGGEDETYDVINVSSQQLYPAIKNLNINVFADGVKVSLGYIGRCSILEVVESYEIKSTASILEYLKNREPSDDDYDLDGEGFIKIENTYRFDEYMNCIVYVRATHLSEMIFKDIMGVQALMLGGDNNGSVQFYVPNTKVPLNNSIDLRKPSSIVFNSSVPPTFVVNEDHYPDNPPNRVIQYKNNVGFMMGYIPDRGIAKSLNTYTTRTFELRNNTGKLYPHPVESDRVGEYPEVGTLYDIPMYRAFTDLSKTRTGNRLSLFEISDGISIYVFLDYSGSMIDTVKISGRVSAGRNIEVVESRNATLLTDMYNNGFIVRAEYVEGETCYLIVKI